VRSARSLLPVLGAALLVRGPLLSAEEKVPEAAAPAEVKPGATALLEAKEGGMRYFLRVPKSYDPRRGARLIVFLHGSNMNGLQYLRSFEAKRWCPDDILACPNGEQGTDPHGANNFTPGSAPLVAGVTREVQAAFKTNRTYVGGHSQGGFLTYSAIMLFPDLYQGAFPMAGDCWMQNEPNLWEEKPEVMEKQKRIAIAVIHGKKDPVVAFRQGKHGHDVFLAMGYPRLRLLAPEHLGHEFMLSPVPEAIEWIDATVGDDPARRAAKAAEWAKAGEWGWAVEAARGIATAKKAPAASKSGSKTVLKGAEAAAKKALKGMAASMEGGKPEEWVPRWLEFRRLFGGTEAARPLVEKYEALRAAQRAAGRDLFRKAQAAFGANEKEGGRAALREILEKAPATYEARYAIEWLAEG
jgi:pimeloyl-ACP methyl ester carboxylesterase